MDRKQRSNIKPTNKKHITLVFGTDYVTSLREFCNSSKFSYRFNWETFEDGIIFCECTLLAPPTGTYHRQRIISKAARICVTQNVDDAQQQTAKILLDSLGWEELKNKTELKTPEEQKIVNNNTTGRKWGDE